MTDESKVRTPRGRSPFGNVLTIGQVAELKQTPQQVVHQAILRGELPAWRFGNQWAIPKREAEQWQLAYRRTRREQ